MQTDLFRKVTDGLSPALADVWITVQRWPVLERTPDAAGHLQETERSMRRTSQPLEERLLRVVRWPRASRVVVVVGTEETEFSVRTGRAVGRPDWRVKARSLAHLRTLRKKHFDGKED